MRKILSFASPSIGSLLSPRDELRLLLDGLALEMLGNKDSVARASDIKARVQDYKSAKFFEDSDDRSPYSTPFSNPESKLLLQFLKGGKGKLGGELKVLADNINALKRLSSTDYEQCDRLLGFVLKSILFRVNGKVDGLGIKETLFLDTLKEPLTKFGDKSCEVILDVLGHHGKNKAELMALYVESKLTSLQN